MVAREKGEAVEGVVYFFFSASQPWRREGVAELRPTPRLGIVDVHVVMVFFPCFLWRPRWCLGELVSNARGSGFALGASLRRLLAALLHHHIGL
jgi:hypothetical protein